MLRFRQLLRRIGETHVLILLLGLLVLAAVWVSTLGAIAKEEREASDRALQITERLIDTYEAQTLRVLNEVNQNIRWICYARRFAGKNGDLEHLLVQNLLLSNMVFTTRIVDSQGRVIASSRATSFPMAVSRELLNHHAHEEGVFVSQPYRLHEGDEPVMDISRSVGDGPASEIVVITMPVSYLVSDYDAARFGASGVLAVVGRDGVFRAKRTGSHVVSGERALYQKLLPDGLQEASHTSLRPSPWDNVLRYMSARPLYGFPLAVVVALPERERLQEVRASAEARISRSWMATAVVVSMALALSALTWHIRVLRAREQQARMAHSEQVEYMAYHDALTSLPNRASFVRMLSSSLSSSLAAQNTFALMLLDLDGFKRVNDVLGHQGGDLLLVQVAQRLKQCVRASDFVARLGGDEFVIILPVMSSEAEIDVVARRLIATIGQPYDLNGKPALVTASVGVAFYPRDGDSEDALTSRADQAMYLAKHGGKNAVVYSP